MLYDNKSALPESVQNVLPAHAQEIYKEAFNNAWAAVKHQYQKGKNDKWHKKS